MAPSDRLKALAPGDRLGAYEILAALGAGGMGEVYRARDMTLGREVAIKVLAGPFAKDPDYLARFEREARILASLNHPSIATIHGVTQSDHGPALVLELVDGFTLQDRLATGALPIDETLRYARQIAEALEAAHDLGIVHRDLKPANVKIRPGGSVKVLDFGIAKILEDYERHGSATMPTVAATERNMLIGTTYYMSPEQARGAEVTRRSDVWGFGTVLFEMLTGTRAFTGSTTSDVLAAILQGAPDWNALPSSTPPGTVRLVRRCLERDPKARLHDIGDARLDIEDEERALRGEAPRHGSRPASQTLPGRRRWTLGLAAIVVIAAAASGAYFYSDRRGDQARPEVRLQLLPPSGTRFINVPAVSPDGRNIAFVTTPEADGPSQLWIRPLAAQISTPLPGTDGARFPFWSPDSRSVGFFAGGRLKRLTLGGDAPIVICQAEIGRGGAWLDDDTIVFAPSQFVPLARVNAAGGQPDPLTTLAEGETGHRFPQRLPGRQLLYLSQNRDPAKNGTRLISMDEPQREIAFFGGDVVAEYVNGFLLFVQPPRLLAQRLSLPSGQLAGEPVDVGSVRLSETSGRYVMSSASSGVLVYEEPRATVGQFTWMSRDGRVLETVGEPDARVGVELSPDGQRLATVKSEQVWTLDIARPVLSRATQGVHKHPIWSPDGNRIATLIQGRGFGLAVTTLATGASTTLLQRTAYVRPLSWTRDGRTLVFFQSGLSRGSAAEIWTMPVDNPERGAPYLQDGASNVEGRLSPDDRWMAYATDRSGRFEVEVRGFPVPGARYPISLEGGGYPKWRADGRELYFVSAQSQLMAVPVRGGDPPVFGRPERLFTVDLIVGHPDRGSVFTEHEYGVSVDGARFLLNHRVSEGASNLTVVLNWSPER